MELPFCKCGCGNRVSSLNNIWINGHNRRNSKLSKKTKEKMSFKLKGNIPWNKGKNKSNCISILEQSNKMKIKHQEKESIYNSLKYKSFHKERMNDDDVKNKISKSSLNRKSPNKGKKVTEKQKQKIRKKLKLNIERIKERYLIFYKEEEMRYNPDKPNEKEIQVHCKNHECENSKEKSGWFTPTRIQLVERIRQLEKDYGNGGSYFYCSEKCKVICPLFNIHSDPCKNIDKPYTLSEYQTFRKFVLKRDNYTCQFCGEKATDVHHERPQKLEPFFTLDPDLAWSCCKECHYKYGHKDECSTGNIASFVCN